MKRVKVRFNLGRGKNYMKWKIQYPSGTTEYYNPTEVQLIMNDCQLKNSRITAEKIFNGQHKVVCAWVLCDSVMVKKMNFTAYDTMNRKRVQYNPRVKPYWTLDGDGNMDGCHLSTIVSVDYKLYAL